MLARDWQKHPFKQLMLHMDFLRIDIDGQPLWLLKPATFMNESGRAVVAALGYYKIAPEECLVVHDDLDLSFHLHLDGRRVRFLPQLRVGAAGRMFRSGAQVRRQFSLAAQTLRLNWAELSPGQRWVQRVQRARARR